MLALMNCHSHDELYLPSGNTVQLPREAERSCVKSNDLDAAVRYAFKAGLITHSDFLEARDALLPDEVVA